MANKKVYMATEETHIRIANALEKLAAKNFCCGSGSSSGGTSGDLSVPVDPSEFMTELLWSNGTTKAPNATVVLNTSGSSGASNEIGIGTGDNVRTDIPVSEIIRKPVILRMVLPTYSVASRNYFAEWEVISPMLALVRAEEENSRVYRTGDIIASVICDFSLIVSCINSNYKARIGYLNKDYTGGNIGSGAHYSPHIENLFNIPLKDIKNGEETEETFPLAFALQESESELDIYINPQKGLVNIYLGGNFDKEHLLFSAFMPGLVCNRPAYVDEDENEYLEEGARVVVTGSASSYNYGCKNYPFFRDGYDTSAEGGNVIVPTAAFDDGFSFSRVLDGSIPTFC